MRLMSGSSLRCSGDRHSTRLRVAGGSCSLEMLLIVSARGVLTPALSGAFGSGAAFAFEDAYVLKAVIGYALERSEDLGYALRLFDEVRGPRYQRLHAILDAGAGNIRDVRSLQLSPEKHVREVVARNWKGGDEGSWIYGYEVGVILWPF